MTPADFVETAADRLGGGDRTSEAKWTSVLPIGEWELPGYVLDDGRRVISRTGATGVLVGQQGGGQLERYLSVHSLRPYVPPELPSLMVYENLDLDVAKWLRENSPKAQRGQNYHQWFSSQYGLKKLIEHLWMLIGMASAHHSIAELTMKMAERYGRVPIQYMLFVPPSVAASPEKSTRARGQARSLPPGPR